MTESRLLRELGWKVLVIWECEAEKPQVLLSRLEEAFSNDGDESDEPVDRG